MGTNQFTYSLLSKVMSSTASKYDGAEEGARALQNEKQKSEQETDDKFKKKQKSDAYELGAYGFSEKYTTSDYGASKAVKDAHSNGAAFGKLDAHQRSAIQKSQYKKK